MASNLPTVMVKPGDHGFEEGYYPPAQPGQGWNDFVDANGIVVRVRSTSPVQTVYVGYLPALPGKSLYNIEVLMPGDVGTTRGARYFVVAHPGGQRRETEVHVDQSYYHDVWVSLGVFDLDPSYPDSGRVNLIDATTDAQPEMIAFSAIRWRPVEQQPDQPPPPPPPPPVGTPHPPEVEGFDPPIGTEAERAAVEVWPPTWVDVNPIGNHYSLGYHTGADLNLRNNQDAHAPVFAAADGVVIVARKLRGSWSNVIVIDHGTVDGKPLYSRSAHLENIQVNEGDRVTRGQKLAQIGLFPGSTNNYHLHFDMSNTTLLRDKPDDWPGENLARVRQNYIDGKAFIKAHRPKRS
ncbi:MAG: peptidoglycan DD-metalloendopeptidase family protein [Chloroflexi bacterium]|nr:peptidoglycan DD-metalloendopeptidase family protein [Chloroflexota bacterium]